MTVTKVTDKIFAKGIEGAICQLPDEKGRELVPMVTYGELFESVIMLCALITLVINFVHKK